MIKSVSLSSEREFTTVIIRFRMIERIERGGYVRL